ncbi:ABC transporter permease [Tepidibacter aestuarii]|uniref:ABC transporter permease n=1 Tax=Tepidibacter aestuarii TaxID=2925782 RepID=UPI0020BFA2F2|nr:ABC transporter permease [Tepidibacter aestuarii]CAH2214563.1 choline ABC transporter (permease) [Tepidibacter aestuarii]
MNWLRVQKAIFEQAPTHLAIHIMLVLITMSIAITIAVPAGIMLTRYKYKKYANIILNILNVLQTIPSFAFIAAAMPILGIGYRPAITVLILQSLLPITRSTIVGLLEVSGDVKEAAMGMGMSQRRILFEVEIPLALPVMLNGIKTSTVYVVSAATLAGFIGAGGLGVLISSGLNMFWPEYLIVGAGLGAILAIFLDRILGYIEQRYTPIGMRID